MLTLGNLVCGFASIVASSQGYNALLTDRPYIGHFTVAAWLIFIGMFCDGLDGKVARMTNATGKFGAELDSLADIITFGAAPAALMLFGAQTLSPGKMTLHPQKNSFIWLVAVLYVCCAALRLARYNVESSSADAKDYFVGLPSPGAAGLVASWMLVWASPSDGQPDRYFMASMLPLTMLAAALMVSRIKFAHAANKLLGGKKSFAFLAMLLFIMGFLLLIGLKKAVAIGFSAYTLFSIALALPALIKKQKETPWAETIRITDEKVV
jgi:CDP-diacylglycerol---serine O-phosphatidyltransferase